MYPLILIKKIGAIIMINGDSVELLKECNAGIKMGVNAIEEVINKTKDKNFVRLLSDSLNEHQRLGSETHKLLNSYEDSGKEPNIMAKSMSHFKSFMMLSVNESDSTVADLITDGCNMGVKSLCKYLNKYKAANEESKDIAKKLISMESQLATDIRCYL